MEKTYNNALKELLDKLDPKKMPLHVAIIMDGNGRWAKERGLPRIVGHKKGIDTTREVVRFANELGIKYLTLFAFSTENWKRPKDEVNALFSLLKEYIRKEIEELNRKNVKLCIIGRRIEGEIQEVVDWACESTSKNTGMVLTIALNYSGRAEIIDAVKKILKEKPSSIDEESFRKYLYFPDLPDADLLIRTSGEMRISNFLLYQIAYTEIYITKCFWPDFSKEEFLLAILDYQRRQRRFGGIIET